MLHTVESSVVEALQELLAINADGQKHFAAAALNAKSERLRQLLSGFEFQRRSWASDLRARLAAIEEQPDDKASFAASLHAWWLDVRGNTWPKTDAALLQDVLDGEAQIRQRYEGIRNHLEGPVASMAQRQWEGLLAAGRALQAVRREIEGRSGE